MRSWKENNKNGELTEYVGSAPHLLIDGNDNNDEHVAEEPDDDDEAKEHGHQNRDHVQQSIHIRVRLRVREIDVAQARPRKVGQLGRAEDLQGFVQRHVPVGQVPQ